MGLNMFAVLHACLLLAGVSATCNFPPVELYLTVDQDCWNGAKQGYLKMNSFDSGSWQTFKSYQASTKVKLPSNKGSHTIKVCFRSSYFDFGSVDIGLTAAGTKFPPSPKKLVAPGSLAGAWYTSYKDLDWQNHGKPALSSNQVGIAYIKSGEWLGYNIQTTASGEYSVHYRLARHCDSTTTKPTTAKPTSVFTCDNSNQQPCGHSSGNGVTNPDTYCCSISEECVGSGSSGGQGSSCLPRYRPKTCSPNPCLNGSTCQTGIGGTSCVCKPTYSGLFCETPTCISPQVACGRTSSGYGNTPDNTCCSSSEDCVSDTSPGGTSWSCITKNRPLTCDPSPCKNGSTCYYGGGGPFCQCINNYSGLFCETAP